MVAPPVTTIDVSWQDLNNDVNKFESSIGQLGRNLENCIGQMGRNLDGLGWNIENSFAQLNQTMGVQSEMINVWLCWFQIGTGTHVASGNQIVDSRSRVIEQN